MNKLFLALTMATGLGLNAQTVEFTTEPVIGEEGGTATIEVSMTNDFLVRDFQCFVNLPEGITPVMNAQGRPDVALGNRHGDHMIASNFIEGQCRVVVFSLTAATIAPGTGVVFTVPIEIQAAPGEYTMTLTDASASTMDAVDIESPVFTSTITVVVYPTGISLSATSGELHVGDTLTLTATLEPENVTEDKLTWTSTDESIATVTDGVVKGVKTGETVITATTANGITATCDVKVTPTSTSVDGIEAPDAQEPAVYFDLLGRRVENPSRGIYIRRQGNRFDKVTVD